MRRSQAAAGAQGEALGIQHDPGQQRLGLGLGHIARIGQLLQQLRQQLTGGGGVGFDKAQGCVLDIGGRHPVMVDDRHPVAGGQQIRVLDPVGPVGIHNHQQGLAVGGQHGLLGAEKQILELRRLAQALQQALGGVVLPVDDDLGLHAALSGHAAHAHRRAHRVQIGKAVAHGQHPGGVPHELGQGTGHDPGLDLGALFHFHAPAA